MITVELFILLKLFIENDVSWWWIALFAFFDWSAWRTIRRAIK